MINIEITYESALNEIVYGQVTRGDYPTPTPTIESQISAKQIEINEYRQEKRARPSTKAADLALMEQLAGELSSLQAQNASIIADNAAARQAVDDAFAAAIETAKEDDDNKWSAIRNYRNYLLQQTDWTQLADSTVASTWTTYRQALRDIPQDNDTPADALAAIEALEQPS